jgi:hypothetical protein
MRKYFCLIFGLFLFSTCCTRPLTIENGEENIGLVAELIPVDGCLLVRLDTTCVYGDCSGYSVIDEYFLPMNGDSVYYFISCPSFDSCSLSINANMDPVINSAVLKLQTGKLISSTTIDYILDTNSYSCKNFFTMWSKLAIVDGNYVAPLYEVVNVKSSCIFVVFHVTGRCIKYRGDVGRNASVLREPEGLALSRTYYLSEYRFSTIERCKQIDSSRFILSAKSIIPVVIQE